jgi:uncharacterized protein (DUF2147 family)
MKSIQTAIFVLAILLAGVAYAQEADPILGKYLPPEKDSVIEIFKCGDKYCGRTFCIKDNAYPADSKLGIPGTPYLDHHNKDPKLKTRPNLGMQFLSGFVAAGDGKYTDGKVYNPRDGKTYCAKIALDGNKLELNGHLCISSWLGKKNTWTRLSGVNLKDKAWDCVK